MKKVITLLTVLLISISSFAQQGINYKAVLKDASGNLLGDTFMNVQFTIHQSTETGTIVYQEDHNYTTDANGLLILNIGTDTSPSVGVFADLAWGADQHFLQTSITYSGGTIDFDATEFMAVPYAKQAESATFRTVNNVTSNSPGDLVTDNLVFGSTQMDDDNTTPNDNARVFFNKAKGAFRAGLVDDTYWDDSEVGSYSVSMGLNTKAKGQNSFAMGGNSTALGKDAVAMGGIATATGQNAISIGNQTNANGLTSVALGAGTISNGNFSTSMNLTTTADALASTAMGRLNIGTGDPDLWVENEPLFEIGNGGYVDGLPVKSNALTVLKNGTITAPSFDITEITDDKALITKEYLEANGATGLEQITEESDTPGVFNTGWRLVGQNPPFGYPIGRDAVDLSDSQELDSFGGASGRNSMAMGFLTRATGDYSTAMGRRTDASGFLSIAMGNQTEAIGSVSTAMGSITEASGPNSTAMGFATTASGEYSTAMGRNTDAIAQASTAIGKFNKLDNTGLFMVGNGTSATAADRNNALIIYENGNAQFDGEIQTTATGNVNMIPIAYGSYDGDDGTDPNDILSGTENFTVTRAGDFTYTISVNGQSLSVNNTSASVVVSTDFFRTANVTYSGGDMKVHIFSSTFNKVPAPFQFIIYKN